MPVDAVSAGASGLVNDYTIGANAEAKQKAETLATQEKLTDAEKEALFLQKMNEGQRTDKLQTTKEDPTKLGKDDFMKLLLATLKYQDPSQPMDTAQLLEQTSTMTNMEQMIQMTEASKKSFEAQQRVQGSSMVGKTAVYDSTDAEGNPITTAGKIDAVEFLAEGKVLVHIGDKKIMMDDILGIADPTEDSNLTDQVDKAVDASKPENQTEKTDTPETQPAPEGTGPSEEAPGDATGTPGTNPNNPTEATQA